MPVGNSALDGLGELDDLDMVDERQPESAEGQTAPAPTPGTPKATKKAKSGAKDAITNVLALLAASGSGSAAPTAPATKGAPRQPLAVVPTVEVRRAMDVLMDAKTIDALPGVLQRTIVNGYPLDWRALIRQMFNWGPKPKATKAVIAAADKLLHSTDSAGRSRYSHAVEALSFASAASQLLEPDHIVRLLNATAATTSAYGPVAYTTAVATKLERVLKHYPAIARVELLESLWVSAHDGRWWDIANGMPRRRVRQADREAREELQAQHRHALAAAHGHAESALVVEALKSGAMTWGADSVAQVAAVAESATFHLQLGRLATTSEELDVPVLLSHLWWLYPHERAESPIVALVQRLVDAIAESMFSEDGERLAASIEEVLPEDPPAQWQELYPAASLKRYPYPMEILALDCTMLPGTGTGDVPASRIEVIRNQNQLATNADYMGNCTGGYHNRCETGAVVMLKVLTDGECVNAELRRSGNGYTLGQVNSRFNGTLNGGRRFEVPPNVRTALAQLVPTIQVAAQ